MRRMIQDVSLVRQPRRYSEMPPSSQCSPPEPLDLLRRLVEEGIMIPKVSESILI